MRIRRIICVPYTYNINKFKLIILSIFQCKLIMVICGSTFFLQTKEAANNHKAN